MLIPTNKIVALKAFCMGRAIAENHLYLQEAILLINTAIAQLEISTELNLRLRLAFYYILRSDIIQEDKASIEDRKKAQLICQEINSSLFENFMSFKSDSRYSNFEHSLEFPGIEIIELSKKQKHFLEKVSLKDLLIKHEINSTLI